VICFKPLYPSLVPLPFAASFPYVRNGLPPLLDRLVLVFFLPPPFCLAMLGHASGAFPSCFPPHSTDAGARGRFSSVFPLRLTFFSSAMTPCRQPALIDLPSITKHCLWSSIFPLEISCGKVSPPRLFNSPPALLKFIIRFFCRKFPQELKVASFTPVHVQFSGSSISLLVL